MMPETVIIQGAESSEAARGKRQATADRAMTLPPRASLRVREAIAAVARGEIVVLDNSSRREGAFIIAAEKVTTEAINFMTKHGRGLICLGLTDAHADRLGLTLMAPEATHGVREEFTVSIDLLEPPSTGISARDRAQCVRRAVAPDARFEEFLRPGHVFPLRAHPGGVLGRPGYAEAAVSLTRLAGLVPAGVVCHIMNADGTMARTDDLLRVSKEHRLRLVTIEDVIACELQLEQATQPLTEANLLTSIGPFVANCFDCAAGHEHHVALIHGGRPKDWEGALVHVHSECLAGDVFGSLHCLCGAQLEEAMRRIIAEGRGVVIYLRDHEEHCLEILNECLRSAGQERGSVRAQDEVGNVRETHRSLAVARILAGLGIRSVRLLTDNPATCEAFEGYGVRVLGCVDLTTSRPA